MIRDILLDKWPFLTILIVTVVTFRFTYLRTHRNSFTFHEEFFCLISIIYIIILYSLVTYVDPNISSGLNLIPFKEILRYDIHSQLFVWNVIGNIVVFIPFGYILSSYTKPKKIWTNIIVPLIVCATIEFVQLQIGRSFDIDDIILNIVGSICGYLIYVGINAIKNKVTILKSDWLNNIICIIIVFCIVLYMLNFWGINIGL